ncbi:MAG: hypothetical protein ACOC9Y_09040 [Chloroflexota bacterium]
MSPPLLLSLVIASLYGCLFHGLFGHRLWQWPLYWGASVLGFFLGYFIGVAFDITFFAVGTVPVISASFGSAVLIGLTWFFSAPHAVMKNR